jgi:outer membrane protein TolC
LAPLLLALALAGCASPDPAADFAQVASATRLHLGKDLRWVRQQVDQDEIDGRVAALLTRPLAVDDAVQLALLNHRGLQARLHDLAIGAAAAAQATRLPNPGFTFGRFERGGEVDLERSLHVNLARWLAAPWLRPLEDRRLEQLRHEVTADVIVHAGETRRAYVRALAAEQTVRYMQQVRDAAEASSELARRMEQVGNFNKLARAREQGFHADAVLALARAELAHKRTRERLLRALGLWGAQAEQIVLPERLPDLPAVPKQQPEIERLAIEQRLDVQAARWGVEGTARTLGLTRATRFVNVLELGLVHDSSNREPRRTGWEISFELPLFDWGSARVARAEAVYMQALARAARIAVDARSEVREAYGRYRIAHDIARHHRDEIVPLAQRISEEQLLRYNGMLIGVFELLADARAQIASVNASIEALGDFWLAETDLEMALIGAVPAVSVSAAPTDLRTRASAGPNSAAAAH